jgi:hypothetical protein
MRIESRQIVHMGIDYHLSPIPALDQRNNLRLQQALLDAGIEVTQGTIQQNQIVIQRAPPQLLEVRLIAQGAAAQAGQILVIAPNPNRPLRQFIDEVEAVLGAFSSTFPAENRQILRADATLRCLYQSTSEHAFMELWEKRLGQPKSALSILGPGIQGGGLRFVIPPQTGDPDPHQIELKIESYLRDAKMVYVEAQFLWPQRKPPGSALNPAADLNLVNDYIENQVHGFMTGVAV